jgi:myo-inositol-1-phosphate synthase
MKPKIALVGIGNCASVLVQGIEYYSRKKDGLWHPSVGGIQVKDIKVSAAFDIDKRKIGLDLAEAIFTSPNVAQKFLEVKSKNVKVMPGLMMGDIPPHLSKNDVLSVKQSEFVRELENSGANILVNLSSSGTDRSTIAYADAAVKAGCSFINCTPSTLVKNKKVVSAYTRSKLVIVGDDLMSQFGGTVFHKGLVSMMAKRGVRLTKSYQLDVGGGTETYNTIDEKIKMTKRQLKTSSVASEVPYRFETVAGTTDYVDYMGNNRTSYFWVEGTIFLGSRVTVDVYLRTSDGANAGNILLDVIRAVFSSVRNGLYGAVNEICAYGFKSPPKKTSFEEGYNLFISKFVNHD